MDSPSGVVLGRPGLVPVKVVRVLKFDSRPPRYTVTVAVGSEGKDYTVQCSADQLLNYRLFRTVVFEQTDRVLPPMSKFGWGRLIDGKAEVVRVPETIAPERALEFCLQEFLKGAKRSSDLKPVLVPGYDNVCRFFRLQAFVEFLEAYKVKVGVPELHEWLKNGGWVEKERRFSRGTCRVFEKPL